MWTLRNCSVCVAEIFIDAGLIAALFFAVVFVQGDLSSQWIRFCVRQGLHLIGSGRLGLHVSVIPDDVLFVQLELFSLMSLSNSGVCVAGDLVG